VESAEGLLRRRSRFICSVLLLVALPPFAAILLVLFESESTAASSGWAREYWWVLVAAATLCFMVLYIATPALLRCPGCRTSLPLLGIGPIRFLPAESRVRYCPSYGGRFREMPL
jgi:hypothetical protein